MTDITRNNIKEFWNTLADADLGWKVHERAQEISDFFDELLAEEYEPRYNDHNEAEYGAHNFTRESRMASILRGFQMVTGLYAEDGLALTVCYDLHSVWMSESVVLEFQEHVMSLMPDPPEFEDDPCFTWWWYYQTLMRSRDAECKGKRKRRNRKSA